MVNHNIILHDKQNISTSSTWNVPVGYIPHGAGDGNLPSWLKKQRAFSLSFLSVVLSVNFNQFPMKETTCCRKA